ncbi:hypothetical protein OSB04_029638 [Centaurea solstitialis]|uniref:Uncharacterized protein n=1 Tax=Centaurea solstitialis TaxID=347529 RepID=A0AA38SIQ5_9ASTR|nr:hypothetical protein OSB04_029638 [Centaurea solstitialis]
MARLSLDLYKAFKSSHNGQEGRNGLTKMLPAEQTQLDASNHSKRHKILDKVALDASSSATPFNDVSDKQSNQNPSPMKASKRVVPAHRRSKVRGVLLQDTEDD